LIRELASGAEWVLFAPFSATGVGAAATQQNLGGTTRQTIKSA
jgi:hypothetical protein